MYISNKCSIGEHKRLQKNIPNLEWMVLYEHYNYHSCTFLDSVFLVVD